MSFLLIGGISFSQSDEWKEQKRYSLRVLRDFGFGKSSMEGVIHEELQKLTESLDQKCGKSMNMRYTFNLSIVNGLWAICTGNQMAINDPKLIKMVKQIDRIMTITAEGKIFNWLNNGGGRGKQKHVYIRMPSYAGKKGNSLAFVSKWGPPPFT